MSDLTKNYTQNFHISILLSVLEGNPFYSFDNNRGNRNSFGSGNGFGRNSPTMHSRSPLASNGRSESPRSMRSNGVNGVKKVNGQEKDQIDPNKGKVFMIDLTLDSDPNLTFLCSGKL